MPNGTHNFLLLGCHVYDCTCGIFRVSGLQTDVANALGCPELSPLGHAKLTVFNPNYSCWVAVTDVSVLPENPRLRLTRTAI